SVLFVIPWSRYWVIGTTDTPWNEDLLNPTATAADIDYVLGQANSVLATPLKRSDVIGTWAGLRPLLQPGTKAGTASAKISREHTVASPVPGLTVIAGGKLTTYRVMGKDAVDFALGDEARLRPSITATLPLVGGHGAEEAAAELALHATRFGWDARLTDHLMHRYGANVRDIVAICEEDSAMAAVVEGAGAYLRAEVLYAITHEGALHLDDIMMRRTRIVYEFVNEGMAALDEIAAIAASALNWTAEETAHETALYRTRADAEARAAMQPDDASASEIRGAVEEIVPWRNPETEAKVALG
ncbi:MAG: glycerol-3-phosphate dehydrogenase, partial [Salinibacterium sp.]|nr:glycerol-3-phosphate dehydrogenase [Salinibacterium sp.]